MPAMMYPLSFVCCTENPQSFLAPPNVFSQSKPGKLTSKGTTSGIICSNRLEAREYLVPSSGGGAVRYSRCDEPGVIWVNCTLAIKVLSSIGTTPTGENAKSRSLSVSTISFRSIPNSGLISLKGAVGLDGDMTVPVN